MAIPRPAHSHPLTLEALLRAVPGLAGAVVDGSGEVEVGGVTLDSRAVRPGDLYAAVRGANAHGAAFAAGAADLGAAAVLTDADGLAAVRGAGLELPVLVVEDPRGVLGAVAAAVYRTTERRPRLLGVTGTNGKTTTAYLLDSALTALGHTTGLIGTVEIRVGDERVKSARTTPEAPDLHGLFAAMAERGVDTCVMEVSSHALALHRVDAVVYDLALFTNLSQDHLDFHHDMEDYFRAKASLFTPERSRGGVVCVDDVWGARLAREATVPVTSVTSRRRSDADWSVESSFGSPDFTLHGPAGRRLELRSWLPGGFNIMNTAMAAVALLRLGEDPEAVRRAVLEPPSVPGRMEVVPGPEGSALAVVDYAHTPEAVEAALEALRPQTHGDLVVVLGAGGDRDRGKRRGMGGAAAAGADVVVVTDDNPRSEDPAAIRAAVLAGAHAQTTHRARTIVEVADRAEAIRHAVALAGADPTATIAVVGKGHETGQEVAGEVHPFDDRAVLAEALAALRKDPA